MRKAQLLYLTTVVLHILLVIYYFKRGQPNNPDYYTFLGDAKIILTIAALLLGAGLYFHVRTAQAGLLTSISLAIVAFFSAIFLNVFLVGMAAALLALLALSTTIDRRPTDALTTQ